MVNRSFGISCVVFLVTIILVFAISRRSEPLVVGGGFEKFPTEIGGYKSSEAFLPASVVEELNPDSHIYRKYQAEGNKEIFLYIGYYGTAKGGRTGHNPSGCLPGAGWGIIKTDRIKLGSKYDPDEVYVNRVISQKGESYVTLLHWYQTNGTEVLATGLQQNIRRFWGKILYNRNDGAFIQLSVVSPKEGLKEAAFLLQQVAERVLDLIPQYWPAEKER